MIQAFTPAFIMLVFTVAMSTLLIMPATRYKMKNELLRFYWWGFWIFLTLIAAFSGGQQILMLAGVEVKQASTFYLAGLMTAYITFVVFAWFRLTWVTLYGFGLNLLRRFKLIKQD